MKSNVGRRMLLALFLLTGLATYLTVAGCGTNTYETRYQERADELRYGAGN